MTAERPPVRTRIYLRLAQTKRARDGWKVEAATKANPRPLTAGSGGLDSEPLNTLHFALDLVIPRELLEPARWPTIEVELTPELTAQVPIEVAQEAPA